MNITDNFTLEELIRSDYATRNNINNTPADNEILENLNLLAHSLEYVRSVIGKPLIITSGYRSPKVNSGIGGSKTSSHMRGLAADFVVSGFDPKCICKIIEEHSPQIAYDQLIQEGHWTHISFADFDSFPRREALTAVFGNGAVKYLKGIR